MNIIRDDELSGLMMIPLLQQWHIDRCNVKECTDSPNTIITGLIQQKFGLCEKHYQEVKKKGKVEFVLEF